MSRLPAVAALAAAALVATACAEATDGTPAGPRLSPLSSASAPTGFPSTTTSVGTSPAPTVAAPTPTPTPTAATLTPPPSSAPAPAPTTWSIATARSKYLQYVRKGNIDIAKFNKIYDTKVTVKVFAGYCSAIAKDQTDLAKQLQAGDWPTSLLPTVRQFIPQILQSGLVYIKCSLAKTVPAAKKALDALPNTSPLANKIRATLKLPKVK